MTGANIPGQGRFTAAIRRGARYRRAFGWGRFLFRLGRFWLWLPKLMDGGWGSMGSPPRAYADRPFGVNLAGYLTGENGLGESARLRAHALETAGIPVALNNVVHQQLVNAERVDAPVSRDNPYRFNLVWVNAPEADGFARRAGPGYFAGHYNIGYWVWEMPAFPDDWLSRFRYYDEIWVPSTFVQDCIAPRSPVPVVRIPHSIRPDRHVPGRAQAWRHEAGVPDGAFVFLFVFHFHSVFERKNPLALIDAFKRTLATEQDAFLVIKTAGGAATRGLALMHEAARGSNVRIIDGVLRKDDVDRLIADCDCYVSLHRSEGFGLTLVEAMTHGKPVIATGYGGNTDFMTRENSHPVGYQLVELARDVGPYRKGWRWADPDVGEAAALMRHVHEHREDARRLGARARRDVEQELHPARIGALVRLRLESLSPAGP